MNGMEERSPVHTPLGLRLAYRIDAPDARLFERERLETTCWVALESRIAGRVAVLARGRSADRDPETVMGRARFLSRIASFWTSGSTGGSVQVELRDGRGSGATAAFVGSDQRMAILPAAIGAMHPMASSTSRCIPERGECCSSESARMSRYSMTIRCA